MSKPADPVALTAELFEEFLENYSLYRSLRLTYFQDMSEFIPAKIDRHCPACGKEQPFLDQGSKEEARKIIAPVLDEVFRENARRAAPFGAREEVLKPYSPPGIYDFKYLCAGCKRSDVAVWLLLGRSGEDDHFLMKVGQYPIWIPPIQPDVRRDLGDDALFLQKALRNMNESYGIGACAYLRRLLENQINPLLQLLLEIRTEEGAGRDELNKIQAAIEERAFSAKTEFASQIAPSYIVVEGFNPFRLIHEHLSDAMHNLDEDEAMKRAAEIVEALVFIMRGLKRHHAERREYADRLKKIRSL